MDRKISEENDPNFCEFMIVLTLVYRYLFIYLWIIKYVEFI